jgi:hypothetical protein
MSRRFPPPVLAAIDQRPAMRERLMFAVIFSLIVVVVAFLIFFAMP